MSPCHKQDTGSGQPEEWESNQWMGTLWTEARVHLTARHRQPRPLQFVHCVLAPPLLLKDNLTKWTGEAGEGKKNNSRREPYLAPWRRISGRAAVSTTLAPGGGEMEKKTEKSRSCLRTRCLPTQFIELGGMHELPHWMERIKKKTSHKWLATPLLINPL